MIADHRVNLARACRGQSAEEHVVDHTTDVSGLLRKQFEEAHPDPLRAIVKEIRRRTDVVE